MVCGLFGQLQSFIITRKGHFKEQKHSSFKFLIMYVNMICAIDYYSKQSVISSVSMW